MKKNILLFLGAMLTTIVGYAEPPEKWLRASAIAIPGTEYPEWIHPYLIKENPKDLGFSTTVINCPIDEGYLNEIVKGLIYKNDLTPRSSFSMDEDAYLSVELDCLRFGALKPDNYHVVMDNIRFRKFTEHENITYRHHFGIRKGYEQEGYPNNLIRTIKPYIESAIATYMNANGLAK